MLDNKLTFTQVVPEESPLDHMRDVNGWKLWKNDNSDPVYKKPYVTFHPICDGVWYQEHDTEEEAIAYCTVERFNQWHDDLLGA